MANIGAEVPGPGVYYYASRFQYADGDFVYGGFNGGFWDGVNNVSGILTVLDPGQPGCRNYRIPRNARLTYVRRTWTICRCIC
jgi:hypothetical protein